MDEASKQLIGEVSTPLPRRPGQPKCVDYEYERLGVCSEFILCEPLAGWPHVKVTERRTKKDWAECIRELVDVHHPQAQKIRLVLDNLNTHTGASLYEAFAPRDGAGLYGGHARPRGRGERQDLLRGMTEFLRRHAEKAGEVWPPQPENP
jgi:hypothetical protein